MITGQNLADRIRYKRADVTMRMAAINIDRLTIAIMETQLLVENFRNEWDLIQVEEDYRAMVRRGIEALGEGRL